MKTQFNIQLKNIKTVDAQIGDIAISGESEYTVEEVVAIATAIPEIFGAMAGAMVKLEEVSSLNKTTEE